MQIEHVNRTIGLQKNIALIAHDAMKDEMIEWCQHHKTELERHVLHGTGTTSSLISKHTGLRVHGVASGPLGGDQQIGAMIVEGKIDFIVFLADPLVSQPHDPDVKALLRLTQVYDIPVAINLSTADYMISSGYMNNLYERRTVDFSKIVKKRVENFQV